MVNKECLEAFGSLLLGRVLCFACHPEDIGVNIPTQLRGEHVGTGFQPAFKFQQRIVLVVERGLEARAYERKQPSLNSYCPAGSGALPGDASWQVGEAERFPEMPADKPGKLPHGS